MALTSSALSSRWLAAAMALATAACAMSPTPALHIAAASSLAPAFDELSRVFEAQTGTPALMSYGASVDLAEQLRNGAPYDVLALADPDLMETITAEGRIDNNTRRVFAQGELALVVLPAWSASIDRGLALLTEPEIRAIAIADPGHAPYGVAARQALVAAGLWESLQPRVVFGGSARHALELVETANAQAGLVPASLLTTTSLPWARISPDLYDPPGYAIGLCLPAPQADLGLAFLDLVSSEEGFKILSDHGLIPTAP